MLSAVCWLLLQALPTEGYPQSPCPDYFSYDSGNFGSTIGVVRVPGDVTLPVTLKVQLAISVALKTKYVGVVMLSDNPSSVLGRLLTSAPATINYTIRFPLPTPLPHLRRIEVNNVTLCTGDGMSSLGYVFGGVTTNILLVHKFPATPVTLTNKVRDVSASGDDDTFPIQRIGGECLSSGIRGDLQSNKKWPWLTAIFVKDDGGVRFQCAGSLITDRHLVTAAHCLRNQKNNNWDKNNFIISLGSHNIENMMGPNSQIRQAVTVIIHPEYNESNYVADIAVLGFEKVSFDDYVSPVCLWDGGTTLKPFIGHFGTVVGWGLDLITRKMKKEPDVFQLPIVDQAECLRSRKEFMYITSERTICAGLRNGSGPCNGDSGSGLLILSYNRNSYIWYLRGLMSLSLLDSNQTTCDLNEYLVFTDVASFTNWLKNVTITH